MANESSISFARRRPSRQCAFTLIELLVTMGIIVVLASLGAFAYGEAIKRGQAAQESGAARVLISSYLSATNDNDGVLMRGYDRTVSDLELADGSAIHGPAAQRYPYRLSNYFSNKLQGVVLVGKNTKQIDPSDSYSVSCYPAFGMNYLFVGGDVHVDGSSPDGKITNEADCATRLAQVEKPSSLLVFATAFGSGSGNGGENIGGYSILTPPRITTEMWSGGAFKPDGNPSEYGNVDARYNDRAICAFLDGSVRNLTIDELRDMRLWSKNAAATDNPDYMVAQAAPPPRGGGRR